MTLFFRLARTVHGGWAGTEPEPSNLVVSDRLPAFWRLGQSPRLTQTRNCRYQPRRVHCWRATVRQGVRGPARPGPARRPRGLDTGPTAPRRGSGCSWCLRRVEWADASIAAVLYVSKDVGCTGKHRALRAVVTSSKLNGCQQLKCL